jgi:hypothetical protein
VTTEPPVIAKPPAFLWIVLLGLTGYSRLEAVPAAYAALP